ncbi:hypothetical protein DFA_05041 [Cavenderia fasciculata]|uniref:Uncharacterized protein n=1 Tax=Cavenderia fasciculata TaxID=261658 RepID=F4PN18_CACFS|nr:uncharacterized protein DFA_05041 [Cavenderia fasciculata]EGG22911.1 hypothetical protein DFA_05041 [Cavenderia fasciculata]|eukprot:XP_004360762.1 hypothetical protein DFA_05041 [Cavenderia fasciculata]
MSEPTTTIRHRAINSSAQEAYRENDPDKSRVAHQLVQEQRKIDDEPHKSNSFKKGSIKYLRSCITFGSYGILFCIAVVIGLEAFFHKFGNISGFTIVRNHHHDRGDRGGGGGTTTSASQDEYDWNLVVVYITTVIVTGTGLALAWIESTNKKTEIDFYHSEKKREMWEYDNYIEGEIKEMVELYCKKGMPEPDAEIVVNLLSKYRDLFVDIMMAEELNLLPVELHLSPMETGLSTLFSFITFGLIPLLPFIFSHIMFTKLHRNIVFPLFILIVESILFIFGALKSKYFTGSLWKEGIIASMNGIISILGSLCVGYYLGYLLS